MNINVIRYADNGDTSLSVVLIDNKFVCYGLEDEERKEKVMHETRIPSGNYKIGLRTHGGHHQKYSTRFAGIHKGMLQIFDVPGFTDILIHCGNNDEHTSGCLLLGSAPTKGFTITESTEAYKRFYPMVLAAIEKGEPVNITFTQIYKSDEEV